MPYAAVNGQQVWYTDTGGDLPPVLFLHGFLMDGTMFDVQVAALKDFYRCIVPDTRGFGETKESADSYTLWDLADDAVGLLDALGIDKAVVIGMSQGGLITQRVAIRYPDRVRALVLMDTEAEGESAEGKAGLYGLFDDWAINGPKNFGGAAAGQLGDDEAVQQHWIARWEQTVPARISVPAAALIERDSVLDRLSLITCPVLQIHGTDDGSVTPDRAKLLNDGLPNSRGFIMIDGARHAPSLTHPDHVTAAISDFLGSL